MNNAKAKRLLKKKRLSGKELGQLQIANTLNDIKRQRGENNKPLFFQADLERMEGALSTKKDFDIYGIYTDIYNGYLNAYNRGLLIFQQFMNGMANLYWQINKLKDIEDAERFVISTPLIMTRSQYDRLKEEAGRKLRERGESFNGVLLNCMILIDCTDPAIEKALEETKKTPAEGNRYLPDYNEFLDNKYYVYPNGRRSDEVTDAEYEAIKNDYAGEVADRWEKLYKLLYDGGEAIRDFIKQQTKEDTALTDEELETALDDFIFAPDYPQSKQQAVVFKVFDEFLGVQTCYDANPKDLTLYDLLPLYGHDYLNGNKKAVEYLKEDAPELYNALEAYIEKVPGLEGVKDRDKEIITWGELSKTITSWSAFTEPLDEQIAEAEGENNIINSYRAMLNGIAITECPQKGQLAENGDYIEAEMPGIDKSTTLYDPAERGREKAKAFNNNLMNNFVRPSIKYCHSLNALLEILEEEYDIEDFVKDGSLRLTRYDEVIDLYRNNLYFLYARVSGTREERKEKRAVLKSAFKDFGTEDFRPPKENIEALRKDFHSWGFGLEAKRQLRQFLLLIDRVAGETL